MAECTAIAGAPDRLGTARDAIAIFTADFRKAGLPTPELDARLLVLHAAGLSHEAYILDPVQALSSDVAMRAAGFRARRLNHEPVSRIMGFREFWGRPFAINSSVLDPRPDTETLIEAALQISREDRGLQQRLKILDLGTGSGCILLTLLAEIPGAWGIGVDIDRSALEVAARNAHHFGLTKRCAFVCGDWFDAFHGPFGLILSNPPYIKATDMDRLERDVRDYDPHRALDGGADGLDFYRRLIGEGCRLLQPGGWLIMELGAGQLPEVADFLKNSFWLLEPNSYRIYRDLGGVERVVALKRQEAL